MSGSVFFTRKRLVLRLKLWNSTWSQKGLLSWLKHTKVNRVAVSRNRTRTVSASLWSGNACLGMCLHLYHGSTWINWIFFYVTCIIQIRVYGLMKAAFSSLGPTWVSGPPLRDPLRLQLLSESRVHRTACRPGERSTATAPFRGFRLRWQIQKVPFAPVPWPTDLSYRLCSVPEISLHHVVFWGMIHGARFFAACVISPPPQAWPGTRSRKNNFRTMFFSCSSSHTVSRTGCSGHFLTHLFLFTSLMGSVFTASQEHDQLCWSAMYRKQHNTEWFIIVQIIFYY